jgi:hypothetical protein
VKTDDTLVMMTWDLIKVGSVCGGVSSFMSSSVILLMVKGLEAEAVFLVYYLLACCLMHVSGILASCTNRFGVINLPRGYGFPF